VPQAERLKARFRCECRLVLSYAYFRTNDLERAIAFYEATVGTLGRAALHYRRAGLGRHRGGLGLRPH